MKKGLTEIVFILDRSGSMGSLESDTIGGFNSMIAKQRIENGNAMWRRIPPPLWITAGMSSRKTVSPWQAISSMLPPVC